jgi:hypothetical protein
MTIAKVAARRLEPLGATRSPVVDDSRRLLVVTA